MSTSAYVLDVNQDNEIRVVYVHWDGGETLANTLRNSYIGNEEKMNKLFETGYISDLFDNEIVSRNKELPITLNGEIMIDDFFDTCFGVEYFHIIKNDELVSVDLESVQNLDICYEELIKDHIFHEIEIQ